MVIEAWNKETFSSTDQRRCDQKKSDYRLLIENKPIKAEPACMVFLSHFREKSKQSFPIRRRTNTVKRHSNMMGRSRYRS